MIGGVDTVVMEGSSVPSFTNVTVEQCISKSEDGTYTLLLKHSYILWFILTYSDDLSWSSKSLITIENEDGIIVFNGNTIGSTKSFTFTCTFSFCYSCISKLSCSKRIISLCTVHPRDG